MQKNSGFTLIELVVVIIILAILAAFALPKFMDLKQEAHSSKVKAVRGSFKAGIAMAHAKCEANGWGDDGGNHVLSGGGTGLSFNASCWPEDWAGSGGKDKIYAGIFNELIDEDVRAVDKNDVVNEDFGVDGTLPATYTYQKGNTEYFFKYDSNNGYVSTISQ